MENHINEFVVRHYNTMARKPFKKDLTYNLRYEVNMVKI
jgi:hypothetical protein